MAIIKKHKLEKDYVQIPNSTARAVDKTSPNPISLQALGLITTLWSYPDTWDLHKTELYKRFAKNKETSVSGIWKELMEANYILEYKVRVGRKYEYLYVYNIEPFTEEQVEEYNQQILDEHGTFWTLDFQVSNLETSNCEPQNEDIIKTLVNKDLINKDFNNFNKDYQSISLDVIKISEKVFGPNIEIDRLTDIINAYYYFYEKLTLIDLQRILFQTKQAQSKKKITSLQSYLFTSFNAAVKQIEIALKNESNATRVEKLPEWFEDNKKEIEQHKEKPNFSPEEIEKRKREIEEILKGSSNK